MFVSFNSASVSSEAICASTYAFVAASCAFDVSATFVIAAEPAFRPLNVGVLPVPKPNEVLAVLPVSAVKFEPSPTMKDHRLELNQQHQKVERQRLVRVYQLLSLKML